MKSTKKKSRQGAFCCLKYSLFLLGIVFSGYLQAQNVSLNLKDAPLENVFKEIKAQTDLSVVFNSNDVDPKKKITVNVSNKPIESVLDNVLSQSNPNLTYVIQGSYIVLSLKTPEPETQTKTSQGGRKIQGTVTDVNDEPLIGVSIRIGDTTTGTITNIDGAFNLDLPAGKSELIFSYVGYVTQHLKVGPKSDMKVILKEDGHVLSEVVVTAMGIEKKAESLVYSTQIVGAQDLVRIKETNVVNSLQGKVSGMTVTPNAGGAGSASKVLLRGNRSIMGENGALIVLDGIPLTNTVSDPFNPTGGGGYNMAYSARREGSDPLSTISPDDIENITVLKGANAAALYGHEAGRGVVIINTKKGRKGSVRIDVSSNSLFETPLMLPKLQNTFGANIIDGNLSGQSWGKRIDQQTSEENAILGVSSGVGNDIRDFFNTGMNYNNSIALSGGSEKVQSYFSYNNVYSEGMIPENKLERSSFFFRQAYNLFNDKLKLDVSGNYIYQKSHNPGSGGTVYNPLYNLYLAPRNIDMAYYQKNIEAPGTWKSNLQKITPLYDPKTSITPPPKDDTNWLSGPQQVWFQGRNVPAANNPYWLVNRVQSDELFARVYGAFKANYQINDLFDIQGRFNYQRVDVDGGAKKYATTVGVTGEYIDRGDYGVTNNHIDELVADGMLSYKQTFAKDFGITANAGGYLKKKNEERVWMYTGGPSNSTVFSKVEDLPTSINVFQTNVSASATTDYKTYSHWIKALYGTAQFSYRNFAYIDGSYRIDWDRAMDQPSITEKRGKSWYDYWSIGGNVLINELVKINNVNQLKWRLSFGIVANPLPNLKYDAQEYDPATGRIKPAARWEFDNPQPEELQTWETGIDLSMFNNKLVMDLTFYNSNLYNQYLEFPTVVGIQKPINTGQLRNRGVEASITYYAINLDKFAWKTGVNFSYNENKIIKTYQDRDDIYIGIGVSDNLRVKFIPGGSYGDIYAKDFSRKAIFHVEKDREKGIMDSQVGDILLGEDGTPTLDSNGGHSVFLGNVNSKVHFGWNNTFSYKDLSLYLLIDGKIGGKVISFTEAHLDMYGVSQRSADARLTGLTTIVQGEEVPAVVMPDGKLAGAYQYYYSIGAAIFPSEYTYDATNLRMREMSLGYTFRNLFGMSKDLNVSLIARNLFFIYKDCPVDPDISLSTQNGLSGVDIFSYPTSRSFGVNLKMTF